MSDLYLADKGPNCRENLIDSGFIHPSHGDNGSIPASGIAKHRTNHKSKPEQTRLASF